MNDYIVESEKIGKYLIEIILDENPDSPRNLDNLGTMVCFHKIYDLGDENHGYNKNDYNTWDELRNAINKKENVAVILPLYLYDHSGLTINTTGFICPWDSMRVGFIFISKEKVREEYNVKYVTRTIQNKIKKYLIDEVKTYDKYLRGDVYGYRITDTETDEEKDTCWGFYGTDDCMEQAKEFVGYNIKQDQPEETEEYYSALLYGVDNNQ